MKDHIKKAQDLVDAYNDGMSDAIKVLNSQFAGAQKMLLTTYLNKVIAEHSQEPANQDKQGTPEDNTAKSESVEVKTKKGANKTG